MTDEWKPIETAPRSGVAILGAWYNSKTPEVYEVNTVRFNPNGTWAFLTPDSDGPYFEELDTDKAPTHWRPMPAPPVSLPMEKRHD